MEDFGKLVENWRAAVLDESEFLYENGWLSPVGDFHGLKNNFDHESWSQEQHGLGRHEMFGRGWVALVAPRSFVGPEPGFLSDKQYDGLGRIVDKLPPHKDGRLSIGYRFWDNGDGGWKETEATGKEDLIDLLRGYVSSTDEKLLTTDSSGCCC